MCPKEFYVPNRNFVSCLCFPYSAHLVLHELFRHKENQSEKEVALWFLMKQSECVNQKLLDTICTDR